VAEVIGKARFIRLGLRDAAGFVGEHDRETGTPPHVRWKETRDHNVRVLNDTADLYRYIDLTPHAEFLASALVQTVEHEKS